MWIFCCGMARSGSTLQYQLTTETVERTGNGAGLGFLADESVLQSWIAHYGARPAQHLVVKSHDFFEAMRPLFDEGCARAIYSYRDLRDVVASMATFQGYSLDDDTNHDFVRGQLERYTAWRVVQPILVSRYEDVVAAELTGEVRRIAAFVETPLDEAAVREIAREHTLDAQVERIEHYRKTDAFVDAHNTRYHPRTQLHPNHIASGQVGRWRGELRPDQIERIERVAGDWLLRHGYTLATR